MFGGALAAGETLTFISVSPFAAMPWSIALAAESLMLRLLPTDASDRSPFRLL